MEAVNRRHCSDKKGARRTRADDLMTSSLLVFFYRRFPSLSSLFFSILKLLLILCLAQSMTAFILCFWI